MILKSGFSPLLSELGNVNFQITIGFADHEKDECWACECK